VDFAMTPAQEDLSALTRQILTDRVTPERLSDLEQAGSAVDESLWSELRTAGIVAATLPERTGGDGYGLAEQCSILAEIGRSLAPVPFLETVVLGAGAIARFGTDRQVSRWAAPAISGDLVVTAALAEPGSDDPRAPSATAQLKDSAWRLCGEKTAVPFGSAAGLFLVPAVTDHGVAVFLVERADPGVSVNAQELIFSHGSAQLTLDDAQVGDARPVGQQDPDGTVPAWLHARATAGLCALQLGVIDRALELTADYARTREQFGRPIGAFQAVAQRLADAYIDVEAVRLTMWQASWRIEAGLPFGAELATAKFWAADAGHRVAHTAVHIHGGVGIDTSHPLHRYYAAAKRNEYALGGATAQLRRLGADLAAMG